MGAMTVSRRRTPTDEETRLIVCYIRAGAFPWVAAGSVGITKNVFDSLMDPQERPELEKFRAEVETASAHARLRQEIRVAQMDPRMYLTRGPGRERPNRPGWTANENKIDVNIQPVGPAPRKVNALALSYNELVQLEKLAAKAGVALDLDQKTIPVNAAGSADEP